MKAFDEFIQIQAFQRLSFEGEMAHRRRLCGPQPAKCYGHGRKNPKTPRLSLLEKLPFDPEPVGRQ
jgi:hypothetical protein